jgi:cytochrome oxidase Cu insertion factor (SCO1/SenC/PrrC family)
MKTWIIASIILGLLVIGGFAVVSAISGSNNVDTFNNEETQVTSSKTCTGCNGGNYGGCTGENNCGLTTCGAVTGTGSCGCGK